jgi:hypothetical protein
MADRAFPKAAFVKGSEVGRVFVAGQEAEFIFGRGTQILPTLGAEIYGRTEPRLVDETAAYHFELGFRMDHQLVGNAAAGWADSGNYFRIDLEQSTDLVNWSLGKFVPAPVPVVNNGDGTWTYWSRSTQPIWYYNTIVDLTLTSNRYGKSITGLSIGQVPISLPGYPYAMPSQAATLQTHLRAAGYTGAVVSSVSQPLTVGAKNHTIDGVKALHITQSGSNVTMVRDNYGTNISLPGYPYAMPSQRATLQTDLRAAGESGAVVMLYGDEWTVFLPNRPAASNAQRQSNISITPDDPYPAWDMFGTYLGNQSAAAVGGTSGNVRASGGAALVESLRQFGRLKITAGTRYDPYLP